VKDRDAPTKEQLAQAYFHQHADHYATSTAHTDPESLQAFADLAQPRPHWRVIDIATGAGHAALALAPRTASVVATDLTYAMLRQTRRLARERGLENLVCAQADVHALPFPDAAADLVTCRRAAHHFSRIQDALSELNRVLKPGATLLIDDRAVPEDPIADRLQQELDTLHDPSHVRQYNCQEWTEMLEKSGFRVDFASIYTRNRPIEAFQNGAPGNNSAKIDEKFRAMTEIELAALHVACNNDTYWSRHWYILLRARKEAGH